MARSLTKDDQTLVQHFCIHLWYSHPNEHVLYHNIDCSHHKNKCSSIKRFNHTNMVWTQLLGVITTCFVPRLGVKGYVLGVNDIAWGVKHWYWVWSVFGVNEGVLRVNNIACGVTSCCWCERVCTGCEWHSMWCEALILGVNWSWCEWRCVRTCVYPWIGSSGILHIY